MPGPTENDVHAYVDDALTSERRLAFESQLAADPGLARQVATFVKQRAALREALAPIAAEPIPKTLDLARMVAASDNKSRTRPAPWLWQAAAAILLLGVGGIGGWWAHTLSEPPTAGLSALAGEASATYTAYAGTSRGLATVQEGGEAELMAWIAEKLHRTVTAPDLTALGFRFKGGRLVATQNGMAGMFVYGGDSGTRIIVLTRPMTVDADTPMRRDAQNGTEVFAWSANGMGFSLVGPAVKDELPPIADEIRRQVDRKV